MIDILIEPFTYDYMAKAILISTIVGALCGFLSSYLMLKGWSLMGDALSHSVVPGVAGAYILGLPFSIGAFISGSLAALQWSGWVALPSRHRPRVNALQAMLSRWRTPGPQYV